MKCVFPLALTHLFAQSLLHGSQEAREAGDLEMQQHSKLVGRGKYIHDFESLSSVHLGFVLKS